MLEGHGPFSARGHGPFSARGRRPFLLGVTDPFLLAPTSGARFLGRLLDFLVFLVLLEPLVQSR